MSLVFSHTVFEHFTLHGCYDALRSLLRFTVVITLYALHFTVVKQFTVHGRYYASRFTVFGFAC